MRDDAMTAAAAKITNIVWGATSNPISNPPITVARLAAG